VAQGPHARLVLLLLLLLMLLVLRLLPRGLQKGFVGHLPRVDAPPPHLLRAIKAHPYVAPLVIEPNQLLDAYPLLF